MNAASEAELAYYLNTRAGLESLGAARFGVSPDELGALAGAGLATVCWLDSAAALLVEPGLLAHGAMRVSEVGAASLIKFEKGRGKALVELGEELGQLGEELGLEERVLDAFARQSAMSLSRLAWLAEAHGTRAMSARLALIGAERGAWVTGSPWFAGAVRLAAEELELAGASAARVPDGPFGELRELSWPELGTRAAETPGSLGAAGWAMLVEPVQRHAEAARSRDALMGSLNASALIPMLPMLSLAAL